MALAFADIITDKTTVDVGKSFKIVFKITGASSSNGFEFPFDNDSLIEDTIEFIKIFPDSFKFPFSNESLSEKKIKFIKKEGS